MSDQLIALGLILAVWAGLLGLGDFVSRLRRDRRRERMEWNHKRWWA